ncbi:MAG: sugar transferase [Erysipelotrichaceae bacterium]|nr:sugar transferase [Erysipelotrichaceae bacterium]
MYKNVIKRLLSILISATLLFFLWWVILLVAVAIKITDPNGPVIFKQKRIGYHGKVYYMYKFRSMKVNSEHTGSGVYSDARDSRVTPIGRFIRKTSLDELPQLVNILKGDMALIGPRSPLTYHPWPYEEYTEEQKKMFSVRPGLTGWAQIHGRKTVEWNKRIQMNVWYAEHCSFFLDLKIFFMTFYVVLFAKDNANVGATAIKK